MSRTLHPTPLESNKPAKPARKSLLQDAKRWKELRAERLQKSSPAAEVAEELTTRSEEQHEASPILGGDFDAPSGTALEELCRDRSVNLAAVAEVYTTVERQSRQSNKENIDTSPRPRPFIDRQKGAKRLDWNDGWEQESRENSPTTAPVAKRRHDHTQGADDDDDFENAVSGAADKRREELRDKTGRSLGVKRSFFGHPRSEALQPVRSAEGSNDNTSDDSRDEQHAQNRQLGTSSAIASSMRASQRPPPSSHPAQNLPRSGQNTYTPPVSSAPVSTAQHLERVREQAKQRVVTIKPRRVQSRSSYTEYEEERLIDLIEECGISYSLIKQMDEVHEDGPRLGERNQVQLKDKAQDMKFQFLKAQASLPTNFDKIPLRKRMQEQLAALGIFSGY